MRNYTNDFSIRRVPLDINVGETPNNSTFPDDFEPGSFLYSHYSNGSSYLSTYKNLKEGEEQFWSVNRLGCRREIGRATQQIVTNGGLRNNMIYLIDLHETSYRPLLSGNPSSLISFGYFPTRKHNVAFSLKLLQLYRNLLLTSFVSVDGFIQTIQNLQPGAKFPADTKSVNRLILI